jgi:uncharacterized protein
MAHFAIHVPDVDAEGKSYHFQLSPEWITSALESTDLRADPAVEDGAVDVFAQRSGDDIVVTGKIHTQIFADCVRCLEDAPVPVDVDIAALFTAKDEGHRPEPDELELTPEEISREFYSGDDIDLDELIRESIILEVPMQPLCDEACSGIEVPEHVRGPKDFGERKGLKGLEALADRMFPKKE